MTIHELKTCPVLFQDMLDGVKTFEYRKNDRQFKVGDRLHLREWCPEAEKYSGRTLAVDVIYMVQGGQFGIPVGYCIMGVRRARVDGN